MHGMFRASKKSRTLPRFPGRVRLSTVSHNRSQILIMLVAMLVPGGISTATAQVLQESEPPQVGAPLVPPLSNRTEPLATITLQDALARARKNYAQYLSALTDAKIAHEDTVQARAALLPSLSYSQQYLGTEGNGKLASGRFVTQDGVHVYRVWGVFHQDMPAGFVTLSPYRRVQASEAVAQAKAELARRGLVVTVMQAYYALIVAQRKYATAQQVLGIVEHFYRDTKLDELTGEKAHSDVVKAQLQLDQQKQVVQDAQLAVRNAHIALAGLLSPTLDLDFVAVDDMDQRPVLPPFPEIQALAERENQDVKAAFAALQQAKSDVTIARASFFATLSVDTDYGIEANALALRSTVAAVKKLGPLPNPGYFITATLNAPVWNWGATLSKLRQALYKRQQAEVELTQAQREGIKNLYAYYNEAATSRAEADTLREAADLAAESLRLTTLRYEAGEATVLEVIDAQNALATARNAYADGQTRYRVALATLQNLTGPF